MPPMKPGNGDLSVSSNAITRCEYVSFFFFFFDSGDKKPNEYSVLKMEFVYTCYGARQAIVMMRMERISHFGTRPSDCVTNNVFAVKLMTIGYRKTNIIILNA